jgi:hypothetical protein
MLAIERRGLLDLYRSSAPGECRLRVKDGQLVIERADPHVWLDDTFLMGTVGKNKDNPWVDVMYQPNDLCDPTDCCQTWRGGHCFKGAVITIRASNGTVIYRIGRFIRRGVWEAHRLGA